MTIINYNNVQGKQGIHMLGVIGFTGAALAFFLYGYTAYKLSADNRAFNGKQYYVAYVLTAVACLVWAAAVIVPDIILPLVLVGDAFLLLASALLLNTLFPKKVTLPYFVIASVAAFGLLALRLLTTETEPFIREGVLVFNTPRAFGFVLSALLLAIWLRANMNFYAKVVHAQFADVLRSAYFYMNLFGFVSVVAFLMARKNLTIVIAFGLLVSSFVFLAALNYHVRTIATRKEVSHAK